MAQKLIMLKTPQQEHAKTLTEKQLKEGVLNVTINSVAWETACTSNPGIIGDPFIQTDEPFKKIFALADGHPVAGSNISKLYHNVCESAHTVDMVPVLVDNSLLSGGKFADAGYRSICDRSKVKFYFGQSVKIPVPEEAVVKGWRCPNTKLWRIPLQTHRTNLTTQTILLNGPTGVE